MNAFQVWRSPSKIVWSNDSESSTRPMICVDVESPSSPHGFASSYIHPGKLRSFSLCLAMTLNRDGQKRLSLVRLTLCWLAKMPDEWILPQFNLVLFYPFDLV